MQPFDPRRTAELVRLAQDRDEAAFAELYARYANRVLRIVRARLGPALRRWLDSNDVLQETFLAAIEGLERFEVRDEGSLVRWLAQLVEHRLADAGRRAGAAKRDARRERALESLRAALASGELVLEPEARMDLPEDLLAAAELREALDRCLAELPTLEREVVLLKDSAGLTWAEVAAELEFRTERAARVAHARALLALAACLRRRGLAPEQGRGGAENRLH